MRLFIAGKVSVARAIALALSPKPHALKQQPSKQQSFERADGYFQTAQGDRVTWTGGHLLELADPEAYDPEYHRWRLEDLPIIPHAKNAGVDAWKVVERDKTREQLKVIQQLLQEADEVIHAGDPDREGQWMIDEVLQYLQNKHPVKRLLMQDLNIPAVRSALTVLRDNHEFIHLSESAKARSRADWLYGINMTRAFTLLGRHSGYEGVLSVGRVQTSVLSMIVNRDQEVEGFKAQHYFEVLAKIASKEKNEFCHAQWQWLRSNKKLDDQPHALLQDQAICEKLVEKITGKSGVVLSRYDGVIKESPPLPFDLPSLQIACSNLFGYSAKETVELCLQLYEKHHLISYPRSDCRYLPERYFEKASEVLEVITSTVKDADLKDKIKKSDCWVKQTCWDDAKVTMHHAIIPVLKIVDTGLLSEQELQIYTLIASRYVEQFYPDHQYIKTEIVFNIEEEIFVFSAQQIAKPDWQVGHAVICNDVDIKEKLTRPPQRFTDASLMEAMHGMGTQTSKALVIDGLLQREFIIKGNKNIFSAPIGRDLVHSFPQIVKKTDTSFEPVNRAEWWEKKLADIAEGIYSYDEFMQEFSRHLSELMEAVRDQKMIKVNSADQILGMDTEKKYYCSKCQALLVMRHSKHGYFWGCSRYPECKNTLPDRVDKNGNHHPKNID